LPASDDSIDLGSSSYRFRDLYLGPTSLHLYSTAGETTTARDWKFSVQETDGASEGNLRLLEGATEIMNVTPGGNVGIGDTTPASLLTVGASDAFQVNSSGVVASGTWQGGVIGAAYGGTGLNGSAAGNGTLLIGNGSGYTLATLTQGSGITVTNGAGSITIAASGSGITSLNSLTGATQTFAVGTSGTDFNIVSSVTTHTFNIPDASGSARGAVTTGTQTLAGAKTFSSQIASTVATGTAPLSVSSTTKVANLNADLLDGFDSSAFGDATAANQTTILSRIGTNSDAASMSTTLFAGQQYIADKMAIGVKMMSAESASTYTHANAAKYCYDLSAVAAVAMDGDTSTTYTDWRLPTVGEAAVFEGTISDTSYVWTATVTTTSTVWVSVRLSDGDWVSSAYTNSGYVRCVR
jgi:hypothetical protein